MENKQGKKEETTLAKVKKYLPIISGLIVAFGTFSNEIHPYVNGFNLSFILIISSYFDWHMGIAWRRYQGKQVLSGWTLVKRLARKSYGALVPFAFEMAGYLFAMFIMLFNYLMPFDDIPLDTSRFVFSWLAISSFIAVGYDSLLSMVANWWLGGHKLPDSVYDWARDEILEKKNRTIDSVPFNSGGKTNETIEVE